VRACLELRTPGLRERRERGQGDDFPVLHEREPLYRRDADTQSRERARSGGDCEDVHGREREADVLEETQDFRRQPLDVRARRIAAALEDNPVVFDHCHASSTRCRVEGQHTHRLHYCSWLTVNS
jgi:hypothetical protein